MESLAPKAVFLSYASQDADAARRIAQALRAEGIEVWFDADGGLEHGDEWDAKIRRQIKECVLFIPLISAHTQARHEGYFRIEWELAAQRAMGIASGIAFILPVVIDDTREPDALVPDRFRMVQWTRLPGGVVTPEVKARYLKLWSHRIGALKLVAPREPNSAGVGAHPADSLVSAPVAVLPISQRSIPLVGRGAELALLRHHLERLAAGHGGTVLLGGEPGVGKTRLAEAVLQEAFTRGWLCAVGHCYEMEGTPAYTPVIEQLEQLARALPAPELSAVLGDAAPEIARFFPGLRRLLPDVGLPMELPPEQQRPYLHARFREYLERLAARGPVVVLTDDLHWADDSSLLLLEALAPRLATLPVLIVGTYRDVDLEIGRPFAAVLERLTRQRHAERVAVRRLPEADVAALLAALGGAPPPAALVHAIQHETEGNPFFVEEVFAHLKEEGRLFDAAGAWRTDLSLAELEVPEGVKLVIGRRLARVAETTRAALTIAAVIGPRFAPRLVEAVAGVGGDAVLDALDEAERAGLVRQLGGTREVRYGFAHELIRHTLLSGLSSPRRQRWHLKIADAMERLYAARLDEHAANLAYHLYEAGAAVEPTRTIGALLRAAEQAVTAGAFTEALAHLERAQTLEPEDPMQCADLQRHRCDSARGLGKWADALVAGEAAIVLFEQLGYRRHVAVFYTLCELRGWRADCAGVLSLVRRGLALATPPQEHVAVRVILGAVGGEHAMMLGRATERDELLQMARSTCQEHGGERERAILAIFSDSMAWGWGQLQVAAARMRETARQLEGTRFQWDLANAYGRYPLVLALLGRNAQLRTELPGMVSVIDRTGYIPARVMVELAMSYVDFADAGDLDQAERYFAGREQPWGSVIPMLGDVAVMLKHCVRFFRGDWTGSLEQLQGLGETAFPTNADLFWTFPFLIRAYRGEPDAVTMVVKKWDDLPRPGLPAFNGAWWSLKHIVEGLVVIGQRAMAAELYPSTREMIALGFTLEFTGAFETSTALAAACGTQWDLAEQHFENALHTVDTTPHILGQGETRRWYAWMCLERGAAGDTEKALGLLDGAQRVYERIGMPKHIEMVHALRARAEQRR